jgi:propionyl-CoA carboxylase alpha chain
VDEGSEIPLFYDPMISKVISWGADRDIAIRTMLRALDEYKISGVRTTIPFCRFVLQHAAFRSGDFSTHFVDDHFDPMSLHQPSENESRAAALGAFLAMRDNHGSEIKPAETGSDTGWSSWVLSRRRRKKHR